MGVGKGWGKGRLWKGDVFDVYMIILRILKMINFNKFYLT